MLNHPFGFWVGSGIGLGSITMFIGDLHLVKVISCVKLRPRKRTITCVCSRLAGAVALLEGDVEQARQFFLKSLRISQESSQTREMLASLRDLANVYIARGNLDDALQLLAVVLSHPANNQNSLNRPERLRDEAEKLRIQIESQLEQTQYQAAWATGQSQRLAEVVA